MSVRDKVTISNRTMTKKKRSIEKKEKTEKGKVGKSKKTVVEPTIDFENSEDSPVASSEETDLAAEVADY